jgi:lichenan operon transcriptional antiterminator
VGIVDDDFTPSVLDRESLSPTSLGNLVAIPHAFLQQTDRPCIAVAILKNPIQWGSEKAQLVFLLNISTSQEADFKPIFTQLYGLISDRKKVQRLIRTTEFISFLKELNG